MSKTPSPAVTLVCEICSKVFTRFSSQTSGTRNFCSMPCYRLGRRKRITRTCLNCGTLFETHPSNAARGNALTCGSRCKYEYIRKGLDVRLWATVLKNPGVDACWNRPGGGNSNYSTISLGGKRGKRVGAHVAAWFLATGRWPQAGEFVCHTCDDRTCVKNDEPGTYIVDEVAYERHGHLWLGDHEANMLDKLAKGRQAKGLDVAGAKLSDAEALDLKTRFEAGSMTQTALAREYGISFQHASDICRGRRRAYLSPTHRDSPAG